MKSISPQSLGIFVAVLGTACFSVKAVFIKLAYHYDVSAISLLTLRMLLALPFFVAAIYYFETKAEHRITTKDFAYIFIAGFFGYYLASLWDFIGLTYIDATIERLILYTYPIFVIAIVSLQQRRRVSLALLLGVMITYGGLSLLFIHQDISWSSKALIGAAYVFASAFVYAIYLVIAGNIIPRVGSNRFNAYAMSVSCIIVLFHSAVDAQSTLLSLPMEVYGYGILLAIISTVLPSFFIMKGIGLLGSSHAAVIGMAGPLFTIFAATLFLGETMVTMQWLGASLIFLGIFIVGKKGAKA